MLKTIALSGASQFAAVMIPYGYALHRGWPLIEAQTLAFSAWIIGHVLLAFVSRSEKEPLYSLGVFSNKAIDLWALAAFAFLLLATQVPAVSAPLKLAPMPMARLGLVFLTSSAVIFWREIVKLVAYKKA
jgi:Ca2+-transporting ATPase